MSVLPPRTVTGQRWATSLTGKYRPFLKRPSLLTAHMRYLQRGHSQDCLMLLFLKFVHLKRHVLPGLSHCPTAPSSPTGGSPRSAPVSSSPTGILGGTAFPVTCHLGRVRRQGCPEHGRVSPVPAPPPLPSGRRPSQVPTGCRSLWRHLNLRFPATPCTCDLVRTTLSASVFPSGVWVTLAPMQG